MLINYLDSSQAMYKSLNFMTALVLTNWLHMKHLDYAQLVKQVNQSTTMSLHMEDVLLLTLLVV